ncbi:hypothetical protein N7478_001482 [Penicillium angulare]|uniref:uncharacterized protein n=1 Tax=Penicillium angulare TaxID=116970 RepID=UPI0025400F02|nr:uncharacterized protein N7478_001482 [Penicillium angulare]KAJ5292231.1 hypothetical protein N7478_001482 [Penicillium angulare]
MTFPQPDSAEKTVRKVDIAQVSLKLLLQLGLAKLKYQHDQFHGPSSDLKDAKQSTPDNEKPFDYSSEFPFSRCGPPFTSPTMQAATYSKKLPRSARNKRAVKFDSNALHSMLTASRKLARSYDDSGCLATPPRVSWRSSHQLPESSPGLNCHKTLQRHQAPFMSDASIPGMPSPVYQNPYDEKNYLFPSLHSFQVVGSVAGSSPPRTPPPKHTCLPPPTPPSQHAAKATLGTPGATVQFCGFRECDTQSCPVGLGKLNSGIFLSHSSGYRGCLGTLEL